MTRPQVVALADYVLRKANELELRMDALMKVTQRGISVPMLDQIREASFLAHCGPTREARKAGTRQLLNCLDDALRESIIHDNRIYLGIVDDDSYCLVSVGVIPAKYGKARVDKCTYLRLG